MKKITLVFVCLLALLSVIGCIEGSPYPETMWTQDVLPGTTDSYHVGNTAYPYNEGHFTNLYINGSYYNGGVVPATTVVAASNSLDINRADYICDGTDDDLVIQAALDNLPVNGGRVALLEGTYNTTSNIEIPDNVVLQGQGFASYIYANSPTITQVIDITGDNSWVKDLKIEIASGCGVAGARPNGINAENRSYIAIAHVRIIGDTSVGQEALAQQNGIRLQDTSYSFIVDCVINNCKRNGIINYAVSETPFGNSILNNASYNNTDSGIYVGGNLEAILDTNQCTNNGLHGVIFYQTQKSTLSNNNCGLNDHYGINLYNVSINNVVSGNSCCDNDWTGIRLAGESIANTITGNVCNENDGTTRHGIDIDDDSDYNVVTGNSCSLNGGQGIYIQNSNYCTVVGNTCVGNTSDGIKVYGDAIGNADKNVINSNASYNNGGDGVEVDGDAGGGNAYAVSNIVTSNQLSGNGGVSLNDDGTTTQIDNNIT